MTLMFRSAGRGRAMRVPPRPTRATKVARIARADAFDAPVLARLEREHVALLVAICDLESSLADMPDAASRTMDGTLLALLRDDLRRTQYALARAAHGLFGLCDDCRKPISRRRLDVRPTTIRCAACEARSAQTRLV